MRIGGNARWYADLLTKEDAEEAVRFAEGKNIPLIILGGGSNTVFADGTIGALVARITADAVSFQENALTVEAGKPLASLVNDCAKRGLDLSPLTGIPGTVGGAIAGNAGQGPKGIWIDHFVESVDTYIHGEWRPFTRGACCFSYRKSQFHKHHASRLPLIWSAILSAPSRPPADIQADIDRLLRKRIETQPYCRTAGSCFKTAGVSPAWKLIDAAGLRGKSFGNITISGKHANFLINDGNATFADAVEAVQTIRRAIPEPLDVEMRFVQNDGTLLF